MVKLLIVFMILCPMTFWVGQDLRGTQEVFYQVFGSMLLCSMLFFNIRPVKKNKISYGIAVFGVYTMLLFILGGANRGATVMLNVFLGVLLYFATLQVKKEDCHLLIKSIIVVASINMLYIGLQLLNFDFIFNIRGPENTILTDAIDPIGFMGIKAVMGIIMSLGAIATLLISPLLSICFLIPLWISRCTGAVMGLTAGALFYFFWIKRKFFWILLPIILLSGALYIVKVDSPMGMMGTRPAMWKMVLKDVVYGYNLKEPRIQSPFIKNLFTGFGLDAFRNGPIVYFKIAGTDTTIRGIRVKNNVYDENGKPFTITPGGHLFSPDGKSVDLWAEAHNEFIQLFYEMGLIGLAIFGFIVFQLKQRFKYALKSKELVTVTALILCLMACSLTQFPFHLSRLGYLLPILLGLFVTYSED